MKQTGCGQESLVLRDYRNASEARRLVPAATIPKHLLSLVRTGKITEADYCILHQRGGTGMFSPLRSNSHSNSNPQKTMSLLLAPFGAQWIKQFVKMISRMLVGVQKPAMWPSCFSPQLRCCPVMGFPGPFREVQLSLNITMLVMYDGSTSKPRTQEAESNVPRAQDI